MGSPAVSFTELRRRLFIHDVWVPLQVHSHRGLPISLPAAFGHLADAPAHIRLLWKPGVHSASSCQTPKSACRQQVQRHSRDGAMQDKHAYSLRDDSPGKCCPGSCPAPLDCPSPERQARSAAGRAGRAAHHPCTRCTQLGRGPADITCGWVLCQSRSCLSTCKESALPASQHAPCWAPFLHELWLRSNIAAEVWLQFNVAHKPRRPSSLAHAERPCCERTAKRGQCPAGCTAPPSRPAGTDAPCKHGRPIAHRAPVVHSCVSPTKLQSLLSFALPCLW